MLNIVLFGPPGAGKGTQALKLSEKYNLKHISTGDILRNEIAQSTPLGLKVKSIMERGELVSDEILIEILQSVIGKNPDVKGFIFDGFPRTIPQAVALKKMLGLTGVHIAGVISLAVEDEELVRRLLNRALELGRSDDTEEVIRRRLEVYNAQTKPLLDFYHDSGLLQEIRGTGTIDAIFERICTVMNELT